MTSGFRHVDINVGQADQDDPRRQGGAPSPRYRRSSWTSSTRWLHRF